MDFSFATHVHRFATLSQLSHADSLMRRKIKKTSGTRVTLPCLYENELKAQIILFELCTGSYSSSRQTRSVFSVARAVCASPLYSDCGWPQTKYVPNVYKLLPFVF